MPDYTVIGAPAEAPELESPYVASATASDFCASVLRLIGKLGPDDPMQIEDASAVLSCLNDLLESWSLDRLYIYTIAPSIYDLVASQQSYQIGPGGADFPTARRPTKIEKANLLIDTGVPQTLRRPIELLTDQGWSAIRIQEISTAIPTRMWNDGGFPYSTLYFWPIPNINYKFELYDWTVLSAVENLADPVDFPLGYRRMLRYNVGLEVAPEFGVVPSDEIKRIAEQSMRLVQNHNAPSYEMICDPAILVSDTRRRTGFNILTGE